MNRLQLGKHYHDRLANGETQQQLADDYNRRHGTRRTVGFISRLIRDYRQSVASTKIIQIPRAEVVKRPENQTTQQNDWLDQRNQLMKDNRFVRIMHMNDVHLPYHDERAIELFYEIAKRFQPDIVVVGSDAFDNPTISRYPADKDISIDDWLVKSEAYWIPIIDGLRAIVPDAILPFIFGNHDLRALEAIGKSTMPQVAMREYRRIVTYGGVLWLGKTESVNIGNLTVAHGNKHNKHTAAGTAELYSFNPVNVGHTHRPQQFRSCVVNGMLCQRVPAYDDRGYPSQWQHGTSTIMLDTKTGAVVQNPLLFAESNHRLWCVYGSETIHSQAINYDRIRLDSVA